MGTVLGLSEGELEGDEVGNDVGIDVGISLYLKEGRELGDSDAEIVLGSLVGSVVL